MDEGKRDLWVGVIATTGAMFCYGSVPIFLRHFANYLDFWTVNAVRYSVAAVFWLPFVAMLSRRQRPVPHRVRGNVWKDALVPACVNLAGQIGWGASPYFVPASTIGFMIRLSFLFTVLLGFVFVRSERPLAKRPLFLTGSVACLAGVALMFVEGLSVGGPGTLAGMGILLATAFFWGAYSVSVRRYMVGYPLRLSFGVICLYTAVGLVALMLAFGDYARLARLNARTWPVLVASAFIGIAFGHVFYYRGIHALGPVVCSGVQTATPFVTYLGAMVFLGEIMTPLQLAGGVAVVAGGGLLIKARSEIESRS